MTMYRNENPSLRGSTRDPRLAKHTTYLARDYALSEEEMKEMASIQKILMLEEKASMNNADETTYRALSSIFFPHHTEQKSVLLKRGSIKFKDKKRDLMLFTRGLVISDVDMSKLATDTFQAQCGKGNNDGDLDPHELGLLLTEHEMEDICDKIDGNLDCPTNDGQGRCSSMPPSLQSSMTSNSSQKGNMFLFGLSQKLDILRSSFTTLTSELDEVPRARKANAMSSSPISPSSKTDSKVKKAFLFSEVDRVEALKRWSSNDIKKYIGSAMADGYEFDEVRIRQCSFAIFIRGSKDKPMLVFCATSEEVNSWMDAFRICIGEQKSRVLGKKRGSFKMSSKIFGINSSMRFRSDPKALAAVIDWDEDEDI